MSREQATVIAFRCAASALRRQRIVAGFTNLSDCACCPEIRKNWRERIDSGEPFVIATRRTERDRDWLADWNEIGFFQYLSWSPGPRGEEEFLDAVGRELESVGFHIERPANRTIAIGLRWPDADAARQKRLDEIAARERREMIAGLLVRYSEGTEHEDTVRHRVGNYWGRKDLEGRPAEDVLDELVTLLGTSSDALIALDALGWSVDAAT